jgi:uncharacterized repeat protein (TIGR03803 family)
VKQVNEWLVFELSPQGGGWNFMTIFTRPDPYGPEQALAIDSAGNLYGTTVYGGTGDYGTAFELSPSIGRWTYTDLHDFTGAMDGGSPNGVVVTGQGGYLYGTTSTGVALGSFSRSTSALPANLGLIAVVKSPLHSFEVGQGRRKGQ